MLAPNGARRTKDDHPAIPVSIDETLQCALEAKQAGAHALHAHVRDKNQKHLLDAGAYSELLAKATPLLGGDYPVQITTEAFNIYSADEQMALVKALKPRFASMAIREIIRTSDVTEPAAFYHWCLREQIGVQHIVYGADELDQFFDYQERNVIPAQQNALIMVVGRYTDSNVADEDECARAVDRISKATPNWMLCAFGQTETACLQQAASAGGGVRVGFENSVEHANGDIAANNIDRVSAVHEAIGNTANQAVDADRLYRLLGGL